MRIACVGYRDWSLNIYSKLQNLFSDHQFLIQSSEKDYDELEIKTFSPSIILFYGWSKIIPSDLVDRYVCLMLHPSPLPKYRGGSPIQNQIIRGEIDSAVTIFVMNKGIDTGPILKQEYLSLSGSLNEIFGRIETIGFNLTRQILVEGLDRKEQDNSQATYFSRLKPEMSEITIQDLTEATSEYLFNKIRMLQDPYPNPYIKTRDGKKLIIKSVVIED